MSTIFTKIINREIPGYFVYEDDVCVVIMDVFPAMAGQTLVILKREVSYLFDATEAEYEHLMKIARRVVHATDKALGTVRTCLVVEGFEVPHVHIKLYPFTTTEGSSLAHTIAKPEQADGALLTELAEKIKAEL